MAQITINIPTPVVSRVLDAMAGTYGYSETITDENGDSVANPESKAAFAKRQVIQCVKANVIAYEANQSAEAARRAAIDAAESQVNLT